MNRQFSEGIMSVKGITIHNTNNKYSAKENLAFMMNSKYSFATHYFVDENEIREAISPKYNCYHTGKGYDKGNLYTIAIEICRSTCSEHLYLEAENRAIGLIRNLMKRYNLNSDCIFFHNDFNKSAYCPHRIFEIYGNKRNFLERNTL